MKGYAKKSLITMFVSAFFIIVASIVFISIQASQDIEAVIDNQHTMKLEHVSAEYAALFSRGVFLTEMVARHVGNNFSLDAYNEDSGHIESLKSTLNQTIFDFAKGENIHKLFLFLIWS